MPIPEAAITRSPQPAGGVAGYRPSESNLEGIVGAGRAMQDAANTVAQTNARQDEIVAQSAANTLATRSLDLNAEFAKVKEGGAVGPQFVDGFTKKFADLKDDVRQGLQSPYQQKVFDQHAEVADLRFKAALYSHQSQETDKFNEHTENNTIDLARAQVFQNPSDPAAVAASMAQMDSAINQKASRMGWSAETTALTKQRYLQTVFDDAVSMMVEANPLGSLPLLNARLGVGGPAQMTGNAAIDGLEPKKLVEYRHRAQAYANVIDNKAEVEQHKQFEDAQKATSQAQKFVLEGGLMNAQYVAELRAETAAVPAFADLAEGYIKMSNLSGGFGSKTLDGQQAQLRAWDAQATSEGSSPELQDLFKAARTIHENQRAAYKENPWAATTRFGRQPAVPEAKITADQLPQLVGQRLPLQATVEQYAGTPVSPLQPSEATDVAVSLGGMSPKQQTDILGATGEQLNAPRIEALAAQLDKNNRPLALVLKRGAGKTTADRSAAFLIADGAQALKDGTVKPDEAKLTGWRAKISTLIRGTLGSQQAEDDAIDMAFYIRAQMEKDGGSVPGFTSGGTEERAVNLAVGQPLTRMGARTLLPLGMSQSEFDAKLGSPEMAAQVGDVVYVGGRPVPKDQFLMRLPGMGLRRAGNGLYTPLGNGAMVTTDPYGTIPLMLRVR